MSASYARPLVDNELTNQFLTRALGYKSSKETGDLAAKVAKAELLLATMSSEDTLKRTKYRHPYYRLDEQREQLREKILAELISNKRLPNDDDTAPGVGGVAPPDSVSIQRDRIAFILIGLPASGKSSVSNKIADNYGAFIVDSDFAKRKFPEFKEEYGAALVHEESTLVTFGLDDAQYKEEPNLLGFCISEGANVVIPKIGAKPDSIRKLRDLLLGYDYQVHLTLIKADRLCATKRAINRFSATNRYVPISLIFDGYSNDPILSYYYMQRDESWASTGVISTEQNPPEVVETSENNPASLFKRDAENDQAA